MFVRLVWKILDHNGLDLTDNVVENTDQEDSWTSDGQV